MTFIDRFKLGFALAILAGIFIGIAGFGYLAVGGIIGAVLFAFGLIGVVSYKCKLFTGTAGYVTKETWPDLSWILVGNLIGTFLVGLMSKVSPMNLHEVAERIIETKISIPGGHLFVLAIGCGFLMTTAVEFAKKNHWLPLLFAVPMFILCGFPHCIADSFYIFACETYSNVSLLIGKYLLIVLGNFVGCNLFRALYFSWQKVTKTHNSDLVCKK